MKVDSTSHRAVALPGLATGVSMRAAASPTGPKGPAVLEVDDGGRRLAIALEVCPHEGVPDNVVALPEHLHEDNRLGDGVRWWLRERPTVDARSVLLEPATARAPERAAREILSGGLVGALLTTSGDGYEPLEIGGATYEVKDVRVDRYNGLVRIGPRTAVELFAPGTRTGVDMVILADVSDSMDVADVPKNGGGYLKRIEVLKRSLRALLAERSRAFGPASQVALLAFDAKARHRFPASGGMARLDATSPKAVTDAFRSAVDQLVPREGSATDIQRALHTAAELLLKHGKPTNERVIVLVSDGAHCPEGRQDDTGKVLAALDEPVSVMQHLHQDMKIRLHAVGISTLDWFKARCRPDDTLEPDHRLLQMLVDAGGGGRPTVGGSDDVGEFFNEIATGLRYPVRGKLSAMAPLRLDQAALARLAVRRAKQAAVIDVAAQRELLRDTADAVHRHSGRLFDDTLFRRQYLDKLELVLVDAVTSDPAAFATSLSAALRRLRRVTPKAEEVECVRQWIRRLDRLDSALAAERDLSELARECRSASPKVPDLAEAVLVAVVAELQALQLKLIKMEPAPQRAVVSRAAGSAMAAITPTVVPMKG